MGHSAAIGRSRSFAAWRPAAISWPSVYCATTLVVWTIAPFLRRIVDWKTHFSAISPFAALPMVMLVPAAMMLFVHRSRRVDKRFELIAVLWMLGFTYALVVAVLAGNVLGGTFTFVQFCLPLGFALWVATRPEDSETWYRRTSKTLIVLAFITGIYGIIQYVFMPPWDAAWMQSIRVKPFGLPLPFEVRVFSTLNSPATFAEFLSVATILYLPRLTLRSGFLLLPIFAGLGLSLLRAAWVVLPPSILVFALLTTRRKQLLTGVAAFVGAGVLAVILSSTLGSSGVGQKLGSRFLTLSDVGNDVSAQNRAEQMSDAFTQVANDPEGFGLGVVGVGTRLNNAYESATTLDSGYLSRLVEMGIPGATACFASLGVALWVAFRIWREALRSGDRRTQDLAAVAVAMQVAMLGLNVFGDFSNGLAAIVSWTSLAFILRGPATDRSAR
jgi:putative inorganic carbon (HCO3(-)) transporter